MFVSLLHYSLKKLHFHLTLLFAQFSNAVKCFKLVEQKKNHEKVEKYTRIVLHRLFITITLFQQCAMHVFFNTKELSSLLKFLDSSQAFLGIQSKI